LEFSVVVPLYNKAPHVEAAIRSALGQSLTPREVIVIDDGSTDGSRETAAKITDDRLKLLNRSPPGPGGYAARNMGIEAASGEWIAFLDADDLWKESHLASLATAIGTCGTRVGCAFSAVEVVRGESRRPYPQSRRHLGEGRALSICEIIRAWLDTGRCPIWTGGAAFRRDVLIQAGLFPAGRARRGGDKDLWLRSIALARSAYAPRATAEFHHDTVNRVSNLTNHSELPILTSTIHALLAQSDDPEERRLLKRLSNQEIVQYARYAAGARAPINMGFLSHLYFPSGFASAAKVTAYLAGGALLRATRPLTRATPAAQRGA
jgi:glycosyltransferase involved in cell wall biosynthesis